MQLTSLERSVAAAEARGIPFWQLVQEYDMEERQVSREDSLLRMERTWQAMVDSVTQYSPERRSLSGLVGGDGERMRLYGEGETLCGGYLSGVIATALCVGESNACMCRIVAAPTAGACGVLPAVLVPLFRSGKVTGERILEGLYVSAGIGMVISHRASIAGASGGCQAEIGSASAMAAGMLVHLLGGDHDQMCHAVAMAMKSLMGLICDPVAGLVEVPCVKRNVIGAVNAVSCAEMAMAGVESKVPVDQVLDCMGDVGRRMPVEFRETALGGLAATPFGQTVKARMEAEAEPEQKVKNF